ncbi:hypothetical protein GCK32_013078 [Trichostrongylus colubriformis]|uniref:Uncharacterized protein n=1 Tax=Trichostrongylus colubriformis TaxID=6319 RepID=A0AAN8FQ70_TRICO
MDATDYTAEPNIARPNNTHTSKSRQSSVVLLFTEMRTGLLLLIFTSCATAALLRLEAKVGERLELNLGNRHGTWYRHTGNGWRRGKCTIPHCAPFPNSTLQKNGSLVFKSVKKSDSGMYLLYGAQERSNRGRRVGPVARVADTVIDLYVHG